jgi:hypothetical protein
MDICVHANDYFPIYQLRTHTTYIFAVKKMYNRKISNSVNVTDSFETSNKKTEIFLGLFS